MIRPATRSVLIRFPHGLGDCVQLLGLLPHLRARHPDVAFDVAVLDQSRASLFPGSCRAVYVLGTEPTDHDQVLTLGWHEAAWCTPGTPGTKTYRAAREAFGFELPPTLAAPQLPRGGAARDPEPYALIHYRGASGKRHKDLDHDAVARLCEAIAARGVQPVILGEREDDSPPYGHLAGCDDAATLLGLMDRARLVVAIDSGPGHLAQCSRAPVLMVWTGHHPYHFADPYGDVHHLVPNWHADLLCEDGRREALEFFASAYKSDTYLESTLADDLIEDALARLPAGDWAPGALTATTYGQQYYEEHKAAGLDYLAYGPWQADYAAWLVGALGLPQGARVLDVGCACGSIAQGFAAAGCDVDAVDVNEHTVSLGRQHAEGARLHVCDAVNLHLFPDAHFDFVHVAQVAEHWRPEHVAMILDELRRVVRPGGLIWTAHDTTELYARQGRRLEDEDPTHLCLWPRSLWREAYRWVGLADVSDEHRAALTDHPLSYIGSGRHRYDWDWWVLRRPVGE